MNLTSHLIALTLSALFCNFIQAQQVCESDIMLLRHEVCESKQNDPIYKEARSANCAAEQYKTCDSNYAYEYSGIFYGRVNGQEPSDAAILNACQARSKVVWGELRSMMINKYRWENGDSSREDNWETSVNDDLGGLPYPNADNRGKFTGLADIKLKYTTEEKVHFLVKQNPVSMEITDYNLGHQINPRGGSWSVRCDYRAKFITKINQPHSTCGVEKFKLCRHKNHGFEKYAAQESASCPQKANQYTAVSLKDLASLREKISRATTPLCPVLDEMSEKTDQDREKKLAGLQSNLALLKRSSHIKDLPVELKPLLASPSPEQKLKLQLLLQIYRLRREVGGSQIELETLKHECQQALRQFLASQSGSGSELEDAFKILSSLGAEKSLSVLPLILPKEAEQWTKKSRADFQKLETRLYAMLFPEGVILADNEFKRARDFIETTDDARAAYRMAEAAVLTSLKKIRTLEEKGMQARDLQLAISRDTTDFKKVQAILSQEFSESKNSFQEAFTAYQGNRDLLKRELIKILEFKIQSYNLSINGTYRPTMFAVIDLAQKLPSPDSRVRLLEGYRALAQLDATKLRSIFRDPKVSTQNPNTWETANSIQLLAKFTSQAVKTLANLKTLLNSTADQRKGLEQSIMAGINSLTENATGLTRVRFINDQIWQNLNGDFVQDSLLRERFNQILEEEYGTFFAILETLPELGGR